MRCPDENVLAGYVDAVLDREQRAAVERHIDGCDPCRAIVSDLARMKHAEAHDEETTMHNAPVTSGHTITLNVGGRAVHVLAGTMIGEYEVTAPIGAGGMGAVFAAVQPRIGKKVAIKVLRRDLSGDPTALARFENEARAVNEIGHPNLVDIFSFGELPDGNPYFVMEHVEGENLSSWLIRNGPVPLETAMPILRQIFDALAAAHERGVIHRDLKPGNIMISRGGAAPRIKVLDFGLAKMTTSSTSDLELTNPGFAMGTPHFMSPEQHLGALVDQRTDIYALGVLVYQMLCGCYPFIGNTPSEIGGHHMHTELVLPSSLVKRLPKSVDQVLSRALAKDATARFISVREFQAALERCIPQRAATPVPAPAPVKNTRTWVAIGATAVAAATLAVVIALVRTSEPAAKNAAAQPPAQPTISMPAVAPLDAAAIVETPTPPTAPIETAPAPAPTNTAVTAKPVVRDPVVRAAKPAKPKTAREPVSTPKREVTPVSTAKREPVSTPKREPVSTPKRETAPSGSDDDKMLLEAGAVKRKPQ